MDHKNKKPKNIADFHHNPLHAKVLKERADYLKIKNVVYAPGQYEGFTKWRPSANPALVNRLRSKEGQAKLLAAYSIIGDRTDFKGQSQLKYRVASEDPMCDNKGNFYHYYWQS